MDRGLYIIIVLYVIDTPKRLDFDLYKSASGLVAQTDSLYLVVRAWCLQECVSFPVFAMPTCFQCKNDFESGAEDFLPSSCGKCDVCLEKTRFPLPLRNAREAPCVTFHTAPRLYLETGCEFIFLPMVVFLVLINQFLSR